MGLADELTDRPWPAPLPHVLGAIASPTLGYKGDNVDERVEGPWQLTRSGKAYVKAHRWQRTDAALQSSLDRTEVGMRLTRSIGTAAVAVALLAGASDASAQADVIMSPHSGRAALIDEYTAFIGGEDLLNSSGERLTRPWQVLRQDRANYHLYGVRQRGDQGDTFFASKSNRAGLEAMIAAGRMSRQAARAILAGGALVHVEIWGYGSVGDYVLVQVD